MSGPANLRVRPCRPALLQGFQESHVQSESSAGQWLFPLAMRPAARLPLVYGLRDGFFFVALRHYPGLSPASSRLTRDHRKRVGKMGRISQNGTHWSEDIDGDYSARPADLRVLLSVSPFPQPRRALDGVKSQGCSSPSAAGIERRERPTPTIEDRIARVIRTV